MSEKYQQISTVAEIQSGFAYPSDSYQDSGIPIIRMSDLKKGYLKFENTKYVSDKWLTSTSAFALNDLDFLLGMSGSLENHAVVKPENLPALLNQRVARLKLKSRSASYKYLTYWLSSEFYYRYAEIQGEGAAQKNISARQIEAFKIRLPRIFEQQKIAAILTSIDTAIEKTEALIEKYQQIKAGLMHDLFTRGVLPNGQLRLPREQAPELYQETAMGWIPKEWNVAKLGVMAKIVSGVTLGGKEASLDTIDAPYLRVANVQDGYLDLTEIKTVRISRKTLEYLRLLPGDVLMNEGGDFDKLGRGTVWNGEIEDCIHQNHVFRVRTDATKLLPYFLAFYSESSFGKKYFVLSSKQSTNLASINSTQLNAYPIVLPSELEQQRIVKRLQGANRLIDSLKAESAKLNKQKLGLMQDLLTGKVPVKLQPENSLEVEAMI